MPYRLRAGTAGYVFHVLNRAVRRAQLFSADSDYQAFLNTMAEAQARIPLRILAYCVMPNHFHLVVWPSTDEELSRFMHWFTGTHSKRWHTCRKTVGTGCVYQGRFKAFPVQTDPHFLTVCRYVEQNALRAGLCATAEAWPWSSLGARSGNVGPVSLHEWPVPRPSDWPRFVNQQPDPSTLKALRNAVRREAPLGTDVWVSEAAGALGLGNRREPLGRPPKRPRGSFYEKRKMTPEVF